MTYNIRNGIQAKQVYISFTDAARDTNGNVGLTSTAFTTLGLETFWGAYYSDLTANNIKYSFTDLGFSATDVTDKFKTNEYDKVDAVTTTDVTLDSATTMTVNAHKGKYVIIRKANGKKIPARIVSNTATKLVLDQDVATLGVAKDDTIILLKVPVGLTMGAYQRLDHIATNFQIDEPTTDTTETFFLGSSDSSGSQNMTIDTNPPSKLTGSVTIRGGVAQLEKLKYNTATAPSGRIRYNLGSEASGNIGLLVIVTTDEGTVTSSDAVTKMIFLNDITLTKVGILDSVSADGKAEATVEFELPGSQARIEVIESQDIDTDVNA